MAPVSTEQVIAPSERKTIFVVGLGMVGIAFIEKMLSLDEQHNYRIVTCGEETHYAYNRVGLTDYFQHRSVAELYLNSPEWYSKQDPDHFMFYTGESVTELHPDQKLVKTSKGRSFTYDICVLATGSHAAYPAYMPSERAVRTNGIFVYRNIADLEKIIDYADKDDIKGGRAIVVGGGLLGLEAAKAVYDLETIPNVTIVNRSGYPLSRQLDEEAGEMVQRRIEALGVQCLTNIGVEQVSVRLDANGEPLLDERGMQTFSGFDLSDGTSIDAELVIFSVGISPRDELASHAGLDCARKGGIVVGDDLQTSAKDVFAIGECASWRGNTYGLIAPGIEMADILSFNLTQTETDVGTFKPRRMNNPDLSTKLKLMGVDVASFGDYFADIRAKERLAKELELKVRKSSSATAPPISLGEPSRLQPAVRIVSEPPKPGDAVVKEELKAVPSDSSNGATTNGATLKASGAEEMPEGVKTPKKRHHHRNPTAPDEPIKCVTYKDPFGSVYKKYIFTADGKYLLGGMMIGDVGDYVKLVSIVKKKKTLEVPPSEFIIGTKAKGEDEGADLDDDTVVCSCHNVTKAHIAKAVSDGVTDIGGLKLKTKAGTGCGGCVPLVTNLLKAEMKKSGQELSNNLCSHFAMSRADLFSVVKIKKLKTFTEIMEQCGVKSDAVGCEICKPTIGSILSSLYAEHVMNPVHHQNQDTNDRFMANIQRNGTFSVIPRIAAGEITPDKLIVIGQVAKKYNLYTKITGGQRIDLFGAMKQDLPDIWAELNAAGFESGHAYGKSLRTVKSCVGTTWCRYGVGDSVGLAIVLEERYKGIRSPHKIKGGVSGCVRECAEAQSKDFGLIGTDKGWNLFVCGNGGATPRHATLFATDIPPSKVIRIIDRFLMYYISTADKLMRTARWVEQMDGGIEKLKKVILEDELGICAQLEKDMDDLVGRYEDEWARVAAEPERRKQFRQFVNTDERQEQIEKIAERGQERPADWPKAFPGVRFEESQMKTPKSAWTWRKMATVADMMPTPAGTTSAAIKYGDTPIAIYHVPKRGYYATQQMCPHRRAFVLDHGIIGDDQNGNLYVSCPLHKRNYRLEGGECMNDSDYKILSFDVKQEGDDLLLLLPESDELDAVLGSSKWMIRKATAEAYDRGSTGGIEIVGPDSAPARPEENDAPKAACANHKLDW